MVVSCLYHASCRMSRDQRVQDNWAFLHAAELASKTKSPVAVVFNLVGPVSAWRTCTMHALDHPCDLPASTGRCFHLRGTPARVLALYILMCHVTAITRACHDWTHATFLCAVWLPSSVVGAPIFVIERVLANLMAIYSQSAAHFGGHGAGLEVACLASCSALGEVRGLTGAALQVPEYLVAGARQFGFMLRGLNIPFFLVKGDPIKTIPEFVKKVKAACLVTDFASLRLGREWRDEVRPA